MRPTLDLRPGDKFGKWELKYLVPDIKPARWVCVCECGTHRSVLQAALTTSRSRSCGCSTPRPELWK